MKSSVKAIFEDRVFNICSPFDNSSDEVVSCLMGGVPESVYIDSETLFTMTSLDEWVSLCKRGLRLIYDSMMVP